MGDHNRPLPKENLSGNLSEQEEKGRTGPRTREEISPVQNKCKDTGHGFDGEREGLGSDGEDEAEAIAGAFHAP